MNPYNLPETKKEQRLLELRKRLEKSTPTPKPNWLPTLVIGAWIATAIIWTIIFLKYS